MSLPSSRHRRLALIDMGTNTFHLLIVELPEPRHQEPITLLRTKVGVRLGEGGISAGYIAPEAYARALHTLTGFKEEIELHQVTEVRATATSAMRVAKNGPELVKEIFEQTGIEVEVIPGEREAELIAKGIRQAVPLGNAPHLLMDIGGGSVEFILADEQNTLWKQSFEIGAQRLLDKFYTADPLPATAVQAQQAYLAEVLAPLTAAVREWQPVALVGASGTFDTLCDLQAARAGQPELVGHQAPGTRISFDSFRTSYEQLLTLDHAGRLALPGMTPMRADMIVVACVLIDFVLTTYGLVHITASAYALKEGLLSEMLGH
ncbi:exopolyphosphatase / guanosine-5'-triphosphate,3'-diphosphate pyrophosphatase [Hymenobacter gelipurpurascens]|uniref:Exopolyphosphatase / guanosine-5'-triphosphate,3'-diphosphate pyrophosphatase n=1 Tax=Hymenobacter gelipurpurascens TaxID=89968 RepID=A0A212UB62_9BACT|nr:phosphatase [Hymenobacter gelipurpurascens]SNC75532.1 exopolyphosphatase / guanosine-5'-triphosphate,3'-diphosphate pyrophosphatase [Hymenobacter gelipurpurascens]